jgi:hypothetical protein
MATAARKGSSSIVVRRHGPSPKLVKAEATIKRMRARARSGTGLEGQLATVGAPLLVGLLKARGTNLPTVGGFDPNLVWGLAGALLGGKVGGSIGQHIKNGGIGLLAVAAGRAGETGSVRTEGDFDGDDDD